MTEKLKLGRLPSTESVKITIAVSVELKSMLDRYAQLHAEASGEKNDLARLIPYMLEAFMTSDRAFTRVNRATRDPGRFDR
jgi:hypothetical protein